MDPIISVEHLSKQYRLGQVGTGSIKHDLTRWWDSLRGKEDRYLMVGEVNDRSKKGKSEYVWALKDVNFEVPAGEVLGIIGKNGAGKSTLLKILSRVTEPSKGRVTMNGRVASLLEVGTGFHPELTGEENIYLNGAILGMSRQEIKKKFDEIVDFSGIERYIDTPVKRYSSGMYVRLGFAVAAHLEPDILIVDEVLAVGDLEFQKRCLGKIRNVSREEGRTVLFVSHQLDSIRQLCKRVIMMKNGSVDFDGPVAETMTHYLTTDVEGTNQKRYDSCIDFIEIKQVGDVLEISLRYNSPEPLEVPHFGFVVSNTAGTPLFASNPTLEKLNIDRNMPYQRGQIKVTVQYPKLIDGTYFCSVWFGSETKNFLEDKDGLRFEVVGMTEKKQYNSNIIGNIVPETRWSIQDENAWQKLIPQS